MSVVNARTQAAGGSRPIPMSGASASVNGPRQVCNRQTDKEGHHNVTNHFLYTTSSQKVHELVTHRPLKQIYKFRKLVLVAPHTTSPDQSSFKLVLPRSCHGSVDSLSMMHNEAPTLVLPVAMRMFDLEDEREDGFTVVGPVGFGRWVTSEKESE